MPSGSNSIRICFAGWFAVVGGLLLAACCTTAAVAADHPNFVIVLADDMGYGDSSAYGGWIETPRMDRMAREGLRFTDFHSSGVVCSPTRAGLMTGRYQQRAGIPGVVLADPKTPAYHWGLQTSEVTFAELLQQAGYATGIFGKWHIGYAKKYNPVHHGFDRFRGFVSGNIDYISHYDRMETYDWWEGLETVQEEGYLTHLITQHAVEFIETNKDRPFCLYVPHGAVHTPIQAPGDLPERGPKAAAGNDGKNSAQKSKKEAQKETVRLMMQALDESLGTILDTVDRLGLGENTLVIFFSDNGGAGHMCNDPLRGGKGTVWEGGHRVPAIARWTGKIKPGTVTDQLCISLDLMPTMLQLADVEVPQGLDLDGVSLVPLLLEGKPLERRQLFWNGEAMRDGPWKLVLKARGLQDAPGLYNVAEDIGEQTNLADQDPQRVRLMTEAIEAWRLDVATGATPQRDVPQSADNKKRARPRRQTAGEPEPH